MILEWYFPCHISLAFFWRFALKQQKGTLFEGHCGQRQGLAIEPRHRALTPGLEGLGSVESKERVSSLKTAS